MPHLLLATGDGCPGVARRQPRRRRRRLPAAADPAAGRRQRAGAHGASAERAQQPQRAPAPPARLRGRRRPERQPQRRGLGDCHAPAGAALAGGARRGRVHPLLPGRCQRAAGVVQGGWVWWMGGWVVGSRSVLGGRGPALDASLCLPARPPPSGRTHLCWLHTRSRSHPLHPMHRRSAWMWTGPWRCCTA